MRKTILFGDLIELGGNATSSPPGDEVAMVALENFFFQLSYPNVSRLGMRRPTLRVDAN